MQPMEDDRIPFVQEDGFVKWIPVVVPLAALVFAVLVFSLSATVL